jgi:hypothetical protein
LALFTKQFPLFSLPVGPHCFTLTKKGPALPALTWFDFIAPTRYNPMNIHQPKGGIMTITFEVWSDFV